MLFCVAGLWQASQCWNGLLKQVLSEGMKTTMATFQSASLKCKLRHAFLLSQLYPVMSTGTRSSSSSLFSKFLITFQRHQTTAARSLFPNAPPPHLLLLLDSNLPFLPQCSLPHCSPPKALAFPPSLFG